MSSKIVEPAECIISYFKNISPIGKKTNGKMISVEDDAQSYLHNDKTGIIVNSDAVKDECLSSTLANSTSSELDKSSQYDSSSENEYTSDDYLDITKAKETIAEMRLAVHNYMHKIKKLDISVEWELPEILKSDKSIFKSTSGIKGPLSPEEVKFIKKRLKQFCKEYNINYDSLRICMYEHITKFRFPNEIRLKFIQYLCKDHINDRNPVTLSRVISKLGLRKGKFNEDEINFLIDMYHNYDGPQLHSVCGVLLNRHRTHIFKKIKRLEKKKLLGSRPLLKNLENKPFKLRRLILENILNRKNFNLTTQRINTHTWISIGRECNTSAASAKAIYMCEIVPQIFADHPVNFHWFFSKLIKRIKLSGWETWEDVSWKGLSQLLYNTGPVFVYVMLRKLVMGFVPKEKWRNFKDCAEHLYCYVLHHFKEWEGEFVTLNKLIIKPNLHE